jgi:hypothetical protein
MKTANAVKIARHLLLSNASTEEKRRRNILVNSSSMHLGASRISRARASEGSVIKANNFHGKPANCRKMSWCKAHSVENIQANAKQLFEMEHPKGLRARQATGFKSLAKFVVTTLANSPE